MNSSFVERFADEQQLPKSFEHTAEQFFIPLASTLATRSRLHKAKPCTTKQPKTPYFIGLNGCQGSGKTTLTAFLTRYLKEQYQLKVCSFSLDDFYLSHKERLNLSKEIHPLLKTRSVPGTHNVQQLNSVLQLLNQQRTPIDIPRFNKAIDDVADKSQWQRITEPVDIVIFEGWCWGVEPQSPEKLEKPINDLEKTQDESGQWRHYVNQQLIKHYQPLYTSMNTWVAILAPSFDCVYQWRLEQENKLANKVKTTNDKIMSPEEIAQFICYFERLTNAALVQMPSFADVVIKLDQQRDVIALNNKFTD